jgi:hypothetical protein
MTLSLDPTKSIELQQSVGIAVRDLGKILGR